MDGQREVVLPCGHHYLTAGVEVAVLTCPACHASHTVDLRDAYALPPDMDLQEPQPCPVHGDPLRIWCEDCAEPACGLCAFDKHPMQSHSLVRAVTFVSSIRKDLLTHSHRMLRQTGREIAKNEDTFQACEDELLKLLEDCQALHQMDAELRALIPAVESATGVRTLHRAEMDLKRIQAKAWTIPVTEEYDDEADSSGAQGGSDSLDSSAGALGVWARRLSGGRAQLLWHNSKLLLCASQGAPPQPQPVLQLLAVHSLGSPQYPEVFLELSVGTQRLGVVFIKLWGHLRRAQNFLLLCLGTLGPSFQGSHLLPVATRGAMDQAVGAGLYRDARGEMSAMPLLTGLEWGGEYQTPVTRGLLVAGPRDRPERDGLYSIVTGVTGGAAGSVCPCKFGWVSAGFEHVQEAALYEPVEQVWVSQCGLVLATHT